MRRCGGRDVQALVSVQYPAQLQLVVVSPGVHVTRVEAADLAQPCQVEQHQSATASTKRRRHACFRDRHSATISRAEREVMHAVAVLEEDVGPVVVHEPRRDAEHALVGLDHCEQAVQAIRQQLDVVVGEEDMSAACRLQTRVAHLGEVARVPFERDQADLGILRAKPFRRCRPWTRRPRR